MTEQNSPARDFSFDDRDEDPLDELARIVSGEKKPKAKADSWLLEQAGQPAQATRPSWDAPLQRSAAASESAAPAAATAPEESGLGDDFDLDIDLGAEIGDELSGDLDHDLENELMHELDAGEPAQEEPAEPEMATQPADAAQDEISTAAGETEGLEAGAEADFDFDAMMAGEEVSEADFASSEDDSSDSDASSLEDQLMVELGLSGKAETSRSSDFVSGFEDEDPAYAKSAPVEDAYDVEGVYEEDASFEGAQSEDGFDTDLAASAFATDLEQADAFDSFDSNDEEDDGDEHALGHAGDFKDKFEAELAINRAAQALNLNARRDAASDDDDMGDLGFDMSVWDSPPPVRRQVAAPAQAANPSAGGQAREQAKERAREQDWSGLEFDSVFEEEMAALQPEGKQVQPAASAYAPRNAQPSRTTMPVASRQAPAPATQASMFNSEREIDDHFAAVFAEELGFDGPATTAPHAATPARYQPAARPAAQPAKAAYRESEYEEPQFTTSFDDEGPAQAKAPATDEYDDYAQAGAAPQGEAYEGDYDDGYEDAGEDGWPDETRRTGSRGFRLAGIALGLALVVGLGAVSYGFFKGGDTPGEPVLVKADTDPVKTKPEDPGGTTVANQDKAAYERVSGKFGEEAKQEKLVSDVEKPVNLVSAAPLSSGVPEGAADAETGLGPDAGKGEARLAPGEEDAVSSPTSLQPRRVRTVTVLRDGTIVQPSESEPAAQSASLNTGSIDGAVSSGTIAVPAPRPEPGSAPAVQPRQAAPRQPGPAQPAPAVVQPRAQAATDTQSGGLPGVSFGQQTVVPVPADPVTTQSVVRASQSDGPVALAPETPQQPAAQAASLEAGAPLNAELSEWVVQISSQRSPEDAQAAYRNLSNRFPSLLEGRQMGIQKADLPDKGVFYRVRIATQSKEDATDFCQRLQNAGGSCFVTR